MVNQNFGDAASDHLENGTRDNRVAGARKDIIYRGAIAEWPALDSIRGSESVDDLHELQLSRCSHHFYTKEPATYN